jgi:hypothetical protein
MQVKWDHDEEPLLTTCSPNTSKYQLALILNPKNLVNQMAQISLVYARDVRSPFARWQIGEIPSAKETLGSMVQNMFLRDMTVIFLWLNSC